MLPRLDDLVTGLLGHQPMHFVAPFGGANASGANVRSLAGFLRASYRTFLLVEPGIHQAPELFVPRVDAADLPPRRPD